MRRNTPKRAAQERLYAKQRLRFLMANPFCPVLGPDCAGGSQQVHHREGREGDRLNNEANFLPICGPCHRRVTENPDWAIANGWSLPRHRIGDAA